MTHPRRGLAAALAATALSATLAASSPAHALQPLRAFLASAHEHNFDRRERLAVAEQKREDAATARRGILPVVSARAQYTFNASEARVTMPVAGKTETAVLSPQHQWDGYFTAAVPIIDSVSWADIRATSLASRAALADVEAMTVDVDKLVARAYYDLHIARCLLASAENTLSTDEANLAQALVKQAAGTAEELDVQRARAAVASSRQSVANALYNAAVAARNLKTVSGLAPEAGEAMAEDDLHEEPALTAFCDRQTPRELAASLNREAQEAVATQVRRRLLPTLSASAQERVTNATGFANHTTYFAVGMTATWTFDAALLSQAAAARAAAHAAEVRAARASQEKDDSVFASWMLVKSQIEACRAARADAEATRLAYAIAKTRYAVGAAKQLDVLQAARDAFAAEVAKIQTNGDLRYDRIALRLAAGHSLDIEEAL